MSEFSELARRVDRLGSRAARAPKGGQLLSEIEDVLAEGYMQALTGEARSRRLGGRIERLVDSLDEAGAAVEIRRITLQRRSLDERVGELRAQLSVLRQHFIRLGGGQTARR